MSVRDPRAVLREAGLRPKRSFGQNFLVAAPIARSIAVACVPDAEVGRARVVEIGAGTGALTLLLAPRARALVAIERDRDLAPLLAQELAPFEHARLVEADAVTLDLAALLGEPEPDSPRVLCGNLPYAITGQLLRRACENATSVERVVFMVQREVADRLAAEPSSKSWGALTVFVRAAFDVRTVLRAPPGAFHPAPDVASAVIELVPVRPPARRGDAGLQDPRAPRLRGPPQDPPERVGRNRARTPRPLQRAAASAGVALEARGETLDVDAFARMADALAAGS